MLATLHHDLTTALLNYAKRTESDVSKWFGNYLSHLQPPDGTGGGQPQQLSRDGPQPLVA